MVRNSPTTKYQIVTFSPPTRQMCRAAVLCCSGPRVRLPSRDPTRNVGPPCLARFSVSEIINPRRLFSSNGGTRLRLAESLGKHCFAKAREPTRSVGPPCLARFSVSEIINPRRLFSSNGGTRLRLAEAMLRQLHIVLGREEAVRCPKQQRTAALQNYTAPIHSSAARLAWPRTC